MAAENKCYLCVHWDLDVKLGNQFPDSTAITYEPELKGLCSCLKPPNNQTKSNQSCIARDSVTGRLCFKEI